VRLEKAIGKRATLVQNIPKDELRRIVVERRIPVKKLKKAYSQRPPINLRSY